MVETLNPAQSINSQESTEPCSKLLTTMSPLARPLETEVKHEKWQFSTIYWLYIGNDARQGLRYYRKLLVSK